MDDVIAGGIPECQSEATRYRCERPSNGCRRAVERVLKARRAVVKQRVTLPIGYDVLLFTNRRVSPSLGYIHAASQ